MKLKQIAAFVLILYAAISVAFLFHDHLKDPPGNHCNICQILHAPAQTPAIATYAPILIVKGVFIPVLQNRSCKILIFYSSERAPPLV